MGTRNGEKRQPRNARDFFNQKKEANAAFGKFISKNYEKWVASAAADAPIMSHQLFQFKVLPHLEPDIPLFFILIDNLRYDQWKAIEPIFAESFRVTEEESFYSILPTATQYCRNAIFAGMMPVEIEKSFLRYGKTMKRKEVKIYTSRSFYLHN